MGVQTTPELIWRKVQHAVLTEAVPNSLSEQPVISVASLDRYRNVPHGASKSRTRLAVRHSVWSYELKLRSHCRTA